MIDGIRILYLETSTEGTIGGSHHSLYQLVKGVTKYGVIPVVAFYEENSLTDRFKDLGCEVHIRPYPRRFNLFKTRKFRVLKFLNSLVYLTYLSTIWSVRNAFWIKRNNIALVHLNNNPFSLDWVFASKLCRIPCIAHQRGIRTHLDKSEIFLAKLADSVICISDYVWKSLEKSGCSTDNFSLIHNGLDLSDFNNVNFKMKPPMNVEVAENCFIIGMVGNIKEWKGQHVLIDALPRIVEKNPNVIALFVGSFDKSNDSYRNRIMDRVEELNLSEKTVFTGYTPNIKEYLHSMDIVVHASTEPEPFGRVIIEAMAMEKPVLVSNAGGAKEIVEHNDSGMLFEPGNSEMLANFVLECMNDPSKMSKLSQRALEQVSERFNINLNLERTYEVYKMALSKIRGDN